MTDAVAFPFDHPAWDNAACAYGDTPVREMLSALAQNWDQEEADYLFFSALLHQGTVYPATFLALPHIVALADTAPPDPLNYFSHFLGGVALQARLPATSGGVSLAEDEPWASTATALMADDALRAAAPRIAEICLAAFHDDPLHFHAAGFAAALGHIELASWLGSGETGYFYCPACGQENQWIGFPDRLAVYRGQFPTEDFLQKSPTHAALMTTQTPNPPKVTALREKLGPLDPTTETLFDNFGADGGCAFCDWTGTTPGPHKIP